ncbi:MAG: hypothetical protein LBJ16_01595 [Holosporaceae bacterium]|nr:hypothetical protein [Holosporaceae bacterium]
MRSFGNFCVASVLGSSCTTCTLRSVCSYKFLEISLFGKKSSKLGRKKSQTDGFVFS